MKMKHVILAIGNLYSLFIASMIQRKPQREKFTHIRHISWLLLLYGKIKSLFLRNKQNAEIYLIL
jgi:hypothetical protein